MTMKIFNGFIAAVVLSISLVAVVPCHAAESAAYQDRGSNVLKVAYYFVYPVGKTLELLVFRPLHAISVATQPDPDLNRATDQYDNRTGWLVSRPSRIQGRSE
jgi:hypothetical protein